jgi:uroporphyrinogen decarboxylase
LYVRIPYELSGKQGRKEVNMAEMTSRQRVLTTLNHQEPDRVPLFAFVLDPKFIKAWGAGNPVAAYQYLDLDCFPVGVQHWCQGVPIMANLRMEIPEEYQTGGGVFAGWHGIDEFGRVWERGSYVGGALKSREDLDRFTPPLRLEERVDPERLKGIKERFPDKVIPLNAHLGPFGLTMESVGFENFFYLLYDDRDLIKEILDKRTQWFIDTCKFAQDQGVDFVVMGDDVAYKNRTFVSPEDFRDLAIPCYRRITEALHVPVIWHSDGFIEPLLEMAVDSGIRGIHAIEPVGGNDMGRIKKKYRDKLVLIGNVDCVYVLTQGDLGIVRRDVDRCMREAKAGGGYMIDTSNSCHSACTLEAIKEMYRYAAEVGRY